MERNPTGAAVAERPSRQSARQEPDLSGDSLLGESMSGASLLGESIGGSAMGMEAMGGLPARPREGAYPPMPPVGRTERFYRNLVRDADAANDPLARCAAKVGQYVSLALDPALDWDHKRKYFDHALRRHCKPPRYADAATWRFFHRLGDLVREHAGAEALRLASAEDDAYAAAAKRGRPRLRLAEEAEAFFGKILCCGDGCPKWFGDDDWWQLKLLRDQWV